MYVVQFLLRLCSMKNELFICRYLSSALCHELHDDNQAHLRDPRSLGRLSEYLKLGGQLFFSQGSKYQI